jgi:ribokinase
LGGPVQFVGCVGNDAFGESLRESLIAAGVGVDGLVVDRREPTGVAAITVTDEGQNTIVVASGANNRVTAAQALPHVAGNGVLLMQLEIPLDEICELCLEATSRTKILNPAPAASLPTEIYPFVDVLIPNETEAKILTGIEVVDFDSACRAAGKLHDRGTQTVIITLGERGSFLSDGESQQAIPAHPVTAVDTTAAGDAFCGALAQFLSQEQSVQDSIRLASIAASISTTRHGAQASMPTLDELMSIAGT